jgi:carboxypeptidase Taq
MEEKLRQLKERLGRIADLHSALGVLHWDMQTYMPKDGGQGRADQIGTLTMLTHQYFVDEEIGKLLDEVGKYASQLDHDSDDASLIRIASREYNKATRVPLTLVEEISNTASLTFQTWQKAKAENNFKLLEPLLQKTFDLQKQLAACFNPPSGNLYDALLDNFEPGITASQIEAIFTPLRSKLLDLIRAIVEHKDRVNDSFLHQSFEGERQLAFGREVASRLGYSFDRGRLDLSAHPFTIHFSRDDVRITTRILDNYLPSALMSIIHEAGHALYEQNTSPTLYRLGLGNGGGKMGEGTSMSTHESQSRFYENILGRSRSFWQHWYPRLQEIFPSQLGSVDLDTFYRALNKSEPSLIRTEADEVTYGMHVMLRFEIENDIINDRIRVHDLPQIWNERMEQYLGIVPPDDSWGVMQDVHWSQASVGYFPDYLLGSIFSVQLWEQMKKENAKVIDEIEAGQYENILTWMRERVHQHGRKFTFGELSERITGTPLRWEPYIDYLTSKYSEIYGL